MAGIERSKCDDGPSEGRSYISSQYRPDIDGLRGILVLGAICFHAKLPGFGGGFTAIDMFFVISGFVITRMILTQQKFGLFDVRDFYVRRILRLVPATTPVLISTTIGSATIMADDEFRSYAYSIVFFIFFAANLFFFIKSDYFSPSSENLPLLHTWSLSVEEQFYLIWPIFLFICARSIKRSAFLLIFSLCLLGSLGFMLWLYPAYSSAGYYLLPSRMWELMAGALIGYLDPFALNSRLRGLLGAGGLAGLIGSFIFIQSDGGYPSIWALVPTLSTVAIIIAADFPVDAQHKPRLANRLLSSRQIVWVGLISYSIYLWHWPILTLARLVELFPLDIVWRAGLMLLSIPIAWGSYIWIERPMRQLAHHRHAGRIATAVLLGSIGLSIGSVFAGRAANRLWSVSPRVERAIAEQDRAATIAEGCHSWPVDRAVPDCRHGPAGQAAGEWLLIGDSHTDALAHGLADALRPRNIALTHLSQSSCPTGIGFEVWIASTNTTTTQCAATNRRIVHKVLKERHIDTLVIGSQWPIYRPSPLWEGVKGVLVDRGKQVDPGKRLEALINDVKRRHGSTVRIVLLSPIPINGVSIPLCILRKERLSLSTDRCLIQPVQLHRSSLASSQSMLTNVANSTGAVIVDGAAAFCNELLCRFGTSDALWWRDDTHLSTEGARMMGRSVVEQLTRPSSGVSKP